MKTKKSSREFIFNSYSQRKIALKFCYQGWAYNGLAAQSKPTPLPTVEETLFEALSKSKLIDPTKSFDGCDWSRCGRTDKGVSSSGQVIALWVRSNFTVKNKPSTISSFRPPTLERPLKFTNDQMNLLNNSDDSQLKDKIINEAREKLNKSLDNDENIQELNYIQILNSILPSTIRILAWSPVHTTFDARFDCLERHYKYFFNVHSSPFGPGLNLDLVKKALEKLKGEHDFRNFCKIDGSKQIKNFKRSINDVWVDDPHTSENDSNLHVVNIRGSAFLYHQVRCLMAIVFLIGSEKEPLTIIEDLMRVSKSENENDSDLPIIESKPNYELANDLPLCLYDCIFPSNKVNWRTSPDNIDIKDDDEQIHRTSAAKSLLNQLFELDLQSSILKCHLKQLEPINQFPNNDKLNAVPIGANNFITSSKYVPLLQRPRGEKAEVINERWRNSDKGKRKLNKQDNGNDDDEMSE